MTQAVKWAAGSSTAYVGEAVRDSKVDVIGVVAIAVVPFVVVDT